MIFEYVSKCINIEDEIIVERVKYETEIIGNYHLKKGLYDLDTFCKELTTICFLADFKIDKKIINKYEGDIEITSSQPKEKLEKCQYFSYNFSNKLAYKIGLITYGELFSRGIDKRGEFYLIKDSEYVPIRSSVSLISHLKLLTLSSNFLQNQKNIAYIVFSTEEILKIMKDKLSIIQIQQNDSNIVSLPSFGK